MGSRNRRQRRQDRSSLTRSIEPPTVMWPEKGSGFDASVYSPAGQAQQEARIIENVDDDPTGVWRAIRESWGTKIILVGIAFLGVIAALQAPLPPLTRGPARITGRPGYRILGGQARR